jgi:hypothetical protein
MPIGTEEDPEDMDEDSASRVSRIYEYIRHLAKYIF